MSAAGWKPSCTHLTQERGCPGCLALAEDVAKMIHDTAVKYVREHPDLIVRLLNKHELLGGKVPPEEKP